MLSVWMLPVFAYCIWVGRIFAKRYKAHWLTFLFFPTTFMIVAFFSLLIHGGLLCWSIYLISLWSGCIAGLLITNPVPVKIDLVRQTLSAPGSWLLLVCLLTLWVSKCSFDWLSVSMPERILQWKLISFAIKGAMTGLLYGQALSFWYRFYVANTCSADELVSVRFTRFYGLERVTAGREGDRSLSVA
jgi:hypothetical protein